MDFDRATNLDLGEINSSPMTAIHEIERWNQRTLSALKSIQEWNRALSGDPKAFALRVGKTGAHRVAEGDTMERIVAKYSLDPKKFARENRKLFSALQILNDARETPSANLLSLDPVSFRVRELELSPCLDGRRPGFHKVIDGEKIIVYAQILAIISPDSALTNYRSEDDVVPIRRELERVYDFSREKKIPYQGKDYTVEFRFDVQPFVIDSEWRKQDFIWLVRSTARETGRKTPLGTSEKTYALGLREIPESQLEGSHLQGQTSHEIVIYPSARDPQVISHEVAHALMSYWHRGAAIPTKDPNASDHAQGGIFANPSKSLSPLNVERIISGLPVYVAGE